MKNYLDEIDIDTKQYFKVLSNEFPDFLNEYIYTEQMQKLDGINQICGAYWRKPGIYEKMYSVLKHSIAVALIVWNFTKDKKQTLAALFHDISSPAFKHCIDFLNGDAEKQESTEELTKEVINNSKEIMELLKKDNIKLEEVCDYKIYPIADNDIPKLSADRLEYTFMNGVYYVQVWNLDDIKDIYDDIVVLDNEDGISELGFKSVEISEKFINAASKLWPLWIRVDDTVTMYFFADIIKKMYTNNYITKKDLYDLSEKEVINRIEQCDDKNISNSFKKFMSYNKFIECDEYRDDKFCVSRKVKRRYINPLTLKGRAYDVSSIVKNYIDKYNDIKLTKYAYIPDDIL